MTLRHNLEHIQSLINSTLEHCEQPLDKVMLLAVSKQQSVATIQEAYALGLRNFGENYYQEAIAKITQLKALEIQWHFIGPIQSNKAKGVAEHFAWVHSVDRLKVAEHLSKQRPADLPKLNVCLQVNLLQEASKSGVPPQEVMALAAKVKQLPHLTLRGLMLIPPPMTNPQEQLAVFTQCHQLMNEINLNIGVSMDTLSMGMSEDLVQAIQAGSTIVRIGRALFGERR